MVKSLVKSRFTAASLVHPATEASQSKRHAKSARAGSAAALAMIGRHSFAFLVLASSCRKRIFLMDVLSSSSRSFFVAAESFETNASRRGISATPAAKLKHSAADLLTCGSKDLTSLNNGSSGSDSPRKSATCNATAINSLLFEAMIRSSGSLNSSRGTSISKVSAPSCTFGSFEKLLLTGGGVSPGFTARNSFTVTVTSGAADGFTLTGGGGSVLRLAV